MVKDLKTEFLEKNVESLVKSVRFMKEEMKLFSKKLEFMQDNNARVAMEQQAIAEAVRQIVVIADNVIEQKKQQADSSSHIQ